MNLSRLLKLRWAAEEKFKERAEIIRQMVICEEVEALNFVRRRGQINAENLSALLRAERAIRDAERSPDPSEEAK